VHLKLKTKLDPLSRV